MRMQNEPAPPAGQGEGLAFQEEERLGDWMIGQLRRMPTFMFSTVLHMAVLMIGILLWQAPIAKTETGVLTVIPNKIQDTTIEDLIKKDNPSDVKPLKPVDQPVEEPTPEDATDDKNTTENEELTDASKGLDTNAASDVDMTGIVSLDSIGLFGKTGGAFGDREGANQKLRSRPSDLGAIANPILDALRWLMRHQSPDGSWDVDGYTCKCDSAFGQACKGVGSVTEADPGVTGLALLAYLGAGYMPDDGSEFGPTIKAGLKYLRELQDNEGYFATEKTSHFYMYGHVIATLAMTEAYGLTGNQIYKSYAQPGLDLILQAQNDHPSEEGRKFGWRYFPQGGDNDSSVSGWMVMALKSAKACGFEVPQESLDGALAWFHFVTDESYYRAGYNTPGGGSALPSELRDRFRSTETATAIAVLSRIFLGESTRQAAVRAGASLLMSDLPVWNTQDGSVDFYYWYYGTLAMYQIGGEHWKKWSESVTGIIIDHQMKRKDGCQWGSWDPAVAKWGGRGGRVYATAINCLTLEVSFRYERVMK